MDYKANMYILFSITILAAGSLAAGEDLSCQASGAAITLGTSEESIPYTIAFIAGAISVISPCSLPLLLGYMAAISKTRRSFVSGTLAFFLGLCLVWVLLGLFVSGIGTALVTSTSTLHGVAGLAMVIFGIVYLFEIDLHLPKAARRVEVTTLGMFLFGILFTLAWAPCAGPILGGILMMALGESPSTGAILMFIYALGFMLTAILLFLLVEKGGRKLQVGRRVSVLGREFGLTNLIGGLLLVAIGLVYLLGGVGLFVELLAPVSNTTVQVEGTMMENPAPFGIALIVVSSALVLGYLRMRKRGDRGKDKPKKSAFKRPKKAP